MEGSFATCRDDCPQYFLFLATTTSVQLVEALRQLRVPKPLCKPLISHSNMAIS